MISSVWLAFVGFVVGVESAGEIVIQNQPSGVMWCGQSFVLNFSYSGNVAAGTELEVQLMFDVSEFARNKEIALLGTVVAPETQFAVNLASPFPAEWLGDQKLSNEGLQQQVLFRVSKVADDKFNSDCSSTFCRDSSFAMICCPAANTAKCGCESCSCANNDVCGSGLECHYTTPRGVCELPLPGLGEKCPGGKCAGNFVCQCPTGTSCLASEKMCNDNRCATPVMGVPSRLNCPCSPDMLCESGTACQLYFCRVSDSVPIGSLACEPSVSVKAKDVCMLHKDGSAPRPYSCQNKQCTICEPGSRLCICKSLTCLNPDDICEGGRCFPRLGCAGCLCNPDSSCNDAEAMCLSGTCKFMTPVAPSSSASVSQSLLPTPTSGTLVSQSTMAPAASEPLSSERLVTPTFSSVLLSDSGSQSSTNGADSGSQSSSNGAVIGGAVAGAVALLAIAGVVCVWCVVRQKKDSQQGSINALPAFDSSQNGAVDSVVSNYSSSIPPQGETAYGSLQINEV